MKEFKQFGLLMWKHGHLRKHQWFCTLVEILLPILFAYMFCSQAAKFISGSSHIPASTKPTLSANDIINESQHFNILYAPMNNFTEKIMKTVRTYPYKAVKGYSDELELLKDLSNRNSSNVDNDNRRIGIVFLNTENEETNPKKMTYKLRDTNYWQTELLFPETMQPGPYNEDPYFTQGLAGVQMVIDAAYIQLFDSHSKFDISNIKYQAFPYPEYEKTNQYKEVAYNAISYIVIAMTLILSAPLIRNIIEEKESGVKELMKLAGASEWLIQFSWFFNALMFSLFSFTIVSYLLQYDFEGPGTAVLLTVPVSVIWTCIILYCVANIAFCFTVSAIFHSATVATSIFMIVFFLLIYASVYLAKVNSLLLIKLMCIFPIVAFSQGFQRIGFFEQHKIPLTWSSLSEVEDETRGVSLLFVFLILIFDTILYLLLTYYISCINPGTFGSKKSPWFFIEMLWPSSRTHSSEELIDMDDDERKFYEDPPKTLEVSIQFKDLSKRFGSFVAVKNLNLKVYKGEITALLGHNGAGKTTTMGILTGMLKATAGSITYDSRIDVLNDMSEFRKSLGMCPQEDRLFPYLSVVNHLYFFGMLKGGSKINVLKEAESYLRLMEIKEKENELSQSLSGGMKRKLCLAIALMGNSQTLILDEPTSGMDVESRRKVWDLLLDLRGTRTIILSTHYMEEADVLGDRIAIMHHGSVVCHGTSLFLKKVYDTGYKVTIIKSPGGSSTSAIKDVLTKIVPNARKESESETEIVYNLPLTESANFFELFRNLESDNLGIQNVGVACTTMEQVFLKVGGASIYDMGRKRSSTVTDGNLLSEHSKNKKTGLTLRFQQLSALLWKKYLYTKRNIINFCYRVIIPSVIIVFVMYTAGAFFKEEQPLSLSLSTYPNAKVMMTDHRKNPTDLFNGTWNYIQANGDEIIPAYNTNIDNDLLDYGRQSLGKFQRELLLAADFNGSKNLALYNLFGLHSLPVLINTLSNIHLALLPGGGRIETINSPVKKSDNNCEPSADDYGLIFLWVAALVFFTLDISYFSAPFVSTERIDGFKHIQLMSNVSAFIYWFSNLMFDSLFLFAIIFVRIVAIKLVDDAGGFLSFSSYPYYIFLLLLWGFIISGLLFSYVINFISSSKEGSYLILFVSTLIGLILVAIFYLVELLIPAGEGIIREIGWIWVITYYGVKYLILLVPPLNYSLAFMKYAHIWYKNAAANQPTCPADASLKSYLVFSSVENKDGLLLEVIFIPVNIILYSALLAVIEAGYLSKLLNAIIIRNFSDVIRGGSDGVDANVADEKKKVDIQTKQLSENVLVNVVSNKRNSDVDNGLESDSDANETVPLNRAQTRNSVVIAQGLKKVFVSKTFQPFVAVEDVNFIVNSGECFGLLGVNGAGKSTTFKMLTAVERPTRGDAFIYNIRLSKDKTSYLSRAGYCAQTNCFIEELTGREMLTLIASLRGVRSDHLKHIVDKWLAILGLENYQNKNCGRYSGGNKRKLCTAMSLIGDPSVVFLDEPTTGVDPVSRRKLYDVMDHSKMSGQAVVLTSHSMEECENLCDRLTIMSKGRMKCIGTAQHLKQRYAQGFSILIKTRERPAEEEERLIGVLKNNMNELFGQQFCVLKDEHKGLLYYQITNVELKWSAIFGNMENLKRNNDIVEDYTVTDTTLEEVFISFAKQE